MSRAVSSIWNFEKASGDVAFMEKDTFKLKHGESSHVVYNKANKNSNNNGYERIPQDTVDTISKVSLSKKNGIEKYNNDGNKRAQDDVGYSIGPHSASSLNYRAEAKRLLGHYREALEDLNLANEVQANNVFTLSTRGIVYKELKDFENALKDLDRADKLRCNDCFVKIQRGEVKRNLKDFEGALVDLNVANALTPNQGIILAQRGAVKLELLCFSEALEDLNKAQKLNPKDASAYQQRGVVRWHLQDSVGALDDLDMADKIEPRCALTLRYRGEIKYMLHRYEEALEDLNFANEIEPNNVFTLSIRGTVYKELKEFENALKDLGKANELDSNKCIVKIQHGIVKQSWRDFEGTLEDLNEANVSILDHSFYFAQRGAVKLEQQKFVDALEDLNRALELKPYNAFVYQQRGIARRELQDLEGALDDLNKAIIIIPNDPYTLCRRGITRRELLDYQGSLTDLNMSNSLQPCNNLTLNERGVTKKLLGDFQGALEDLCMANHIKGDQAFTLKHRGSANRELGNLVEAIQDLTWANHLESNDFFTLLELAMTKNLNHDYEGALMDYNKVVKMEPNDPWILRQRGTLRRMLGDYEGALQDLNKGDIDCDEFQPKLFSMTVARIMERCFTKYEMKDVDGALQDAKMVRELWGVHGQSLIMGERLKPATIGVPLENAFSKEHVSQRLNDIETLTSSDYILWIDHRNLRFSRNMGRGSYGYVQKCKWMDKNINVAVKYLSSVIKDAFEYEVRMLANMRHPRVVRLIGCSYNEEEKQGLLVMELMQWNLRSLIDGQKYENGLPFDHQVAAHIMLQIAEAMEYLHEKGVLHRDLKSSNVLVNKLDNGKEEYVVKIADFGMSKLQGKNNMPYFMTADVGAVLWRAPEVFKNGSYQKYSFPADVWSYGMTCFEILSGEVPFEGVLCSQIRTKILGGLRPELPASCPGVLKLLLTKCWSFLPCDRPTFPEIRRTLKLYLGIVTSRDLSEFRVGNAIRPYALRKHSI